MTRCCVPGCMNFYHGYRPSELCNEHGGGYGNERDQQPPAPPITPLMAEVLNEMANSNAEPPTGQSEAVARPIYDELVARADRLELRVKELDQYLDAQCRIGMEYKDKIAALSDDNEKLRSAIERVEARVKFWLSLSAMSISSQGYAFAKDINKALGRATEET